MPGLWQLPYEELSLISGLLDGFDICRLWLSGDPRLVMRLEHEGVKRFSISLAQTVTRKWPKVISRFRHLEYLNISPSSVDQIIWFTEVDLEGLSPTLRHLELDFHHLTFPLLGLPFALPDRHPDPVWSPPTEAQFDAMSPFLMGSHFQNLETFIIWERMLAPHLVVPLLPKSLLKLRLPYEYMSASTIRALPPNLTHLELPNLDPVPDSCTFPSGLTYLDIQNVGSLSSEQVPRFPASLTDLDITSCRSDIIHLPSSLVSLALNYNEFVDDSALLRFQPTLLHLHCLFQAYLTIPPPNLQTLHVENLNISDEEASTLPRSLTDLWISSSPFTSECLKYFPPHLRSLHIRVPFTASSSPYQFLGTLEALDARKVDLAALKGATKLRRLRCTQFAFKEEDECQCLASLTELDCRGNSFLAVQPVFEAFSSHLSELRISCPSPFPSIWLPRTLRSIHISGPGILDDGFLAHIPPSISDLELFSSTSVSDTGIASLPRNITRLWLAPCQNLTDEAIRHLPPSIVSLTLSGVHDLNLTDACTPYFPRRLTRLTLSSCPNMTDASMKHLPRTLTFAAIGLDNPFTQQCLPDVPPFLKGILAQFGGRTQSEAEEFLSKLEQQEVYT